MVPLGLMILARGRAGAWYVQEWQAAQADPVPSSVELVGQNFRIAAGHPDFIVHGCALSCRACVREGDGIHKQDAPGEAQAKPA
jgi:hypothetical protein